MASSKRTVQHQTYVYVDLVCLTIKDRELQVLTVERQTAKKGMLAIPGGLLEDHEDLAEAAVRELREETGISLKPSEIHQIGAYGHPERDTRYGRAISVAYLALIPTPTSHWQDPMRVAVRLSPIHSPSAKARWSSTIATSFAMHAKLHVVSWKTRQSRLISATSTSR